MIILSYENLGVHVHCWFVEMLKGYMGNKRLGTPALNQN